MADRSPVARRLYRAIAYPLQACGAILIYSFFRLLPIDTASGLAGWLGRTIGPHLGISRRARRNLNHALPVLDDVAVEKVIEEMWDNLGRVLGEYPHLDRIAADDARVEIVGAQFIEPFRNEDGAPCIFFSGHLANWELLALAAQRIGVRYVQVYRAANNPFVDTLLRRVRGLEDADIVPKGPQGARGAITALKAGRRLGMLVDQKMNDGISVRFFGREAMTAPALAQLALRQKCPMIPVRMERLGGCRFRATIMAPMSIENSGDRHADVAATMTQVNSLLEKWIRDRPGQWLWLHRRWPDS